MAPLSQLSLSEPIKLLSVGDSGTGKTGAIFDLAELGFKIRILDFDNGAVTLYRELAKKRQTPLEVIDNIDIAAVQENRVAMPGGKYTIVRPTAWERGLSILDKWPGNLGKPQRWGLDTILVVDSLTLASTAALEFVMMMNNRTGENPSQPNWGDGQRHVESLIQMLYTSQVGCHVIITSHISTVANESGVETGYPMSLGKALPPKIPRYFNIMVSFRSTGGASSRTRKMLSRSHPLVETKVPLLDFPQEIPLTDKPLAKLWAALGYPKAPEIEEKAEADTHQPMTLTIQPQKPKLATLR